MPTQTYVCPNCGGKGCAVCQNTGQVTLSDREVQELQKMMTRPFPQTQSDFSPVLPEDSFAHQEKKIRSKMAGILTLVFLVLFSGSAFLSWIFSHTLKPFLQLWSLVATIVIIRGISQVRFFKEEKIKDFLGEIEEEGIKIKKSPFYPLF